MDVLIAKTFVIVHLVARPDNTVSTILAAVVDAKETKPPPTFRIWVWPIDADEYEQSLFRSTGKGVSFPFAIRRLIDWLGLQNVDINDENVMLAVPSNHDVAVVLKTTVRQLQKITGKTDKLHPFFSRWANIGDHVAQVPYRTNGTESAKQSVAVLMNAAETFKAYLSAETRTLHADAKLEVAEETMEHSDQLPDVRAMHPGVKHVIKHELFERSLKKDAQAVQTVAKQAEGIKKPRASLLPGQLSETCLSVFKSTAAYIRSQKGSKSLVSTARANVKRWRASHVAAAFDRPFQLQSVVNVRLSDTDWSKALYDATRLVGAEFVLVSIANTVYMGGNAGVRLRFDAAMDADVARRSTLAAVTGKRWSGLQVQLLHAEDGRFLLMGQRFAALRRPINQGTGASTGVKRAFQVPFRLMLCANPSKISVAEAKRRVWSVLLTAMDAGIKDLLVPLDLGTGTEAGPEPIFKYWKDILQNRFATNFDTVVFFRGMHTTDAHVRLAQTCGLISLVCRFDGGCRIGNPKHWLKRSHSQQCSPMLVAERETEEEEEEEEEEDEGQTESRDSDQAVSQPTVS